MKRARSLFSLLLTILLLAEAFPTAALADVLQDRTGQPCSVDADGVLHITGDYQTNIGESYTSVIVEAGGVISGDISFDVPVTVRGDYFSSGALKDYGTIRGGTFHGSVTNKGKITGGVFTDTVTNDAVITGGTFSGKVINTSPGITGGEFTGEVSTSRYGLSGGRYSGTVTLSAAGSIDGGTYTAGAKIVMEGGCLGIAGGRFYCAVTNTSYIAGGTFENTVINHGKVAGNATFNQKLENHDEVFSREMLKWNNLNGEVVNNGVISGSRFGPNCLLSGDGEVYVIVTLLFKGGIIVDRYIYDKSFPYGGNVKECLAAWEKKHNCLNEWMRRTGELTNVLMLPIEDDETFTLSSTGNSFTYDPFFQVRDGILEVRKDWDGAKPTPPDESKYQSIRVYEGVKLSDGNWNKLLVNHGEVSGGVYTGEVINKKTISGGQFQGESVTSEATVSGGHFDVTTFTNTGTVTDASFGGAKNTLLVNGSSGRILRCNYTSGVSVDTTAEYPQGICVPVQIDFGNGNRIKIDDLPNFSMKMDQWLRELYPNARFSYNGTPVGSNLTFANFGERVFRMIEQCTFTWTDGPDYQATASFMDGLSMPARVVYKELAPAVCTKAGKGLYTATVEKAGETFTETKETVLPAKGHDLRYHAQGAEIIETCQTCSHSVKALLKAPKESYAYTGEPITPASMLFGLGWAGRREYPIVYENNREPGIASATCTIGDATAKIQFAITSDARLAKITIDEMPKKLRYFEGDKTLDLTGLTVTAHYSDGRKVILPEGAYTVTGFSSAPGRHTITVAYQDRTASFAITVNAKSLVKMEVTTPPTKTEYPYGEDALDLTGGKLTLYYDNETTAEIDLKPEMILEGLHGDKVGRQTISVQYSENGVTRTATFPVEVLPKPAPTLPGDITGDGRVNSKDLSRLLQHLASRDIPIREGDLDGDGDVSMRDVTKLLDILCGTGTAEM